MSDFALSRLRLILVGSRFPENIGMAARACANMGAAGLDLVQPERWVPEKARPLATRQGESVLEHVRVFSTVSEAAASCTLLIGTTARTGGWRQSLLSPEQAASLLADALNEGEQAALLFGPEDTGLLNSDIELCQHLVCIPTHAEASSLNVAQACLIMLYECFKACSKPRNLNRNQSRRVSHAEQELLLESLRQSLVELDVVHKENPEYFFMPLRRFFNRADLRRHEFDIFMGVCRQIRHRLGLK